MISKSYEQYKEEVLNIYEEYVDTFKKFGKKVNESIENEANKIKEEIFNLMVLGEAKSGKSTFINAYLGKEILPMDVRQCTSAIIKISYGNEFKLVSKTAGGGERTVIGDDKIAEFLKEHASISDKYREIPITTINNELLIKNGKLKKKISDGDIKELLEHVKNENIYNIEIKKYEELIRKYIEENQDTWDKIITEFDITYKLPEAMKGYTIIDSPGVGAGGNVGEITEKYIKEANAIIFVKSLFGQALESSSFMNFLRSNCSEKQKEFLFLVFTGKSNLQGSEFERLRLQAIEMYEKDIEKEKIIFVDSKMQLFLNKCLELKTEEKIDKFFDDLDEEGNDFPAVSNIWLRAKGNFRQFQDKIEEQSNFNNINKAIEKFAKSANFLLLKKFLENLKKEYNKEESIISDLLKELKETIKDPEELEHRINKKKKELEEAYNKMNDTVNEIFNKYMDNLNGGKIFEESKKLESDYNGKINRFVNISENEITNQTFDEIKKISMDAIVEVNDFRDRITKEMIEECNDKLVEYSGEIDAEILTPNFTESDFDNISDLAKKETSGDKTVYEGGTFKKTIQVPYYHRKEHVKLVAEGIEKRLKNEIIPPIKDNIIEYANKCKNIYTTKLTENYNNLKREYENLIKDKDDNEKNLKKIENFEEEIKKIKETLENINIKNKEIENHVK